MVYSVLQPKVGKIVFGTDAVIECLERRKAKLVIIAEDASERTINNIQFICNKYNADYIVIGNKEELSHAIGKVNKAVFAIREKNLADGVKKIIDGGDAI